MACEFLAIGQSESAWAVLMMLKELSLVNVPRVCMCYLPMPVKEILFEVTFVDHVLQGEDKLTLTA